MQTNFVMLVFTCEAITFIHGEGFLYVSIFASSVWNQD